MLIQRRRLAFDRAKHRRAEIHSARRRQETRTPPAGRRGRHDESEIDLTLRRPVARPGPSILMLIALLSVIVPGRKSTVALASSGEYFAVGCHPTVQGVESPEPITWGGSAFIAIWSLSSPRSCVICLRCWNWRYYSTSI